MKSKLFLFPIFILLSVLLASNVSAIVVYGGWEGGGQSIQIDQGESINFNADFFSTTPPMTINVGLYDSDNDLIHSFEINDKVVNTYGYYNVYTITENIYNTAGNFEIILTGSDTFPSSDSHTILLTVEDVSEPNNPPVIISDPIMEVNENELYSYQILAVDPDNHPLSYSLVAPAWLSINSQTGLITGIAPGVDTNTDFSVNVVVSDGIDTDTQSYTLTVIWIPNPSLSQTVELVEDVKIGYNAILSELDSAILKIYYKEFGSDNYDLIITKDIITPSYTETFSYEIHGITKGYYSFVINAIGYNLSETDEITVLDYAPEVDLSSVSANFNEEDSIVITLPVPTDINPEDNPVAYINAIPLDTKTTADINGNVLTLEGNRDETGDYQVELEFGDPQGETATTILNGYIYALPDISGVLENNEEDIGIQGVIRVYYPDPDNSSNYLALEIDKINDGEGSIIDASLGKIQTTSEGTFSFQINERASELSEIVLQARIGEPGDYTSYVRTITLPGDDHNITPAVRAVPYAPYEDDPGLFRQFMSELCSDQPNTRFDFDGEYLRGINPEFENYTGLIGIEILSENPFGAENGTFTTEQQNNIKNKILDSTDISGIIGNYDISGEQVSIVNGSEGHFIFYEYHVDPKVRVVADPGWIVVVPYKNMPYTGVAEPRKAGRSLVYGGTIYIQPGAGGDGYIPSHEFGHMFIGTGHPISMPPNQTVMSTISILQTTGIADKKAGKLIYEQTYMTFPLEIFPRVDYLENILGLRFYGERQITGTFSEYYFEAEDDDGDDDNFAGDHQNSNEDRVIGFDDSGSSNGVNANRPYDGTIHLQSNTDKNNIITSLSNIIRQVISFISQKLRSVFSI